MDEEGTTLSELLTSLGEESPEGISIGLVLDHFGRRAFGAALFLFAAPNLLPLPPGSSTVLGLPLLLIAPQLAVGGEKPWIPRRMADQTLSPAVLSSVVRRVVPGLRKVEGLSRQRVDFMFGRVGDVAIGGVCTLLAAVLILPIPLGNLLPAGAVSILALSLIQRDGLLAVLGYLVAVVSLAVLALSGHVVVSAAIRLASWLGA